MYKKIKTNLAIRSSLKATKPSRPISTISKQKGTRHSTTTQLAPLPASLYGFSDRLSKTRSSLAAKNWRQALFPVPSPASKREVELLGEWLNSVLAENLENHDNPLDVCINAQHWFSVAFNELVRQVAIDCAERGRLFAVIWKRNQDLLSKIVQVQREERKYIMQCHKDRMQFLRADLEYCQTRLQTVTNAYNDEHDRWNSVHDRDINKFANLQQKIEHQTKARKDLNEEIRALRIRLGLPEEEEEKDTENVPSEPYTLQAMNGKIQEFRWKLKNEELDLNECDKILHTINYFVDTKLHDPETANIFNLRVMFDHYFLTLPQNVQPVIRSIPWIMALISYIYSYYMTFLASNSIDRSILERPFSETVYDFLLGVYGTRVVAEQVLFDLLTTIRKNLDSGIPRILLFARFFGLLEPLPIECFHFYLHALTVMNRTNPGPLFPDNESPDPSICGIPTPSACLAGSQIFERITSGKSLNFYTARLNKIANDGNLKFGGRSLSELDTVLEYIISAYVEECAKLEDNLKDQFSKIPNKEISTFSQFYSIMTSFRGKVDIDKLPKIFHTALQRSPNGKISCDMLLEIVKKAKLNLPANLEPFDFLSDQNPDDILKFMIMEFEERTPEYEQLLVLLTNAGDEILYKQLISAKTKFEQALSSKGLGRTFQQIQREFYEKLYLVKAFHNIH